MKTSAKAGVFFMRYESMNIYEYTRGLGLGLRFYGEPMLSCVKEVIKG